MDAQLRFETRATEAPRAKLADRHDDDLILGTCGHAAPFGKVGLGLLGHARRRQRLDERRLRRGLRRGIRALHGSLISCLRACGCGGVRLGFCTQRTDVEWFAA